MQLFSLSLLSAVLPLIALGHAVPLAADSDSASVLLPRSQVCYGSNTKAGTRFEPRDLSLPEPSPRLTARSPSRMTFCTPGTQTYIVVDFAHQLPDEAQTLQMTIDAHHDVTSWVSEHGDGPLPHGYVTFQQHGLQLHYQNANNHQLTWNVVGCACFALWEYVNWLSTTWAAAGAVNFAVFDGTSQVGTGQLQML